MRKAAIFLLSLFLYGTLIAQTVPAPAEFLGYEPGAHFTPHHKIVGYFSAVAQALPAQVKLEAYGKSYEGRPLVLAYVASAENMARLESIRENNLRLAGMLDDKIAPDENAPAIVWLSYNVHGNEPASSEAAMKTLYELINPANAASKEWLKKVVIIIDPCINPDGRDRYVNWYNDMVGSGPDPDPQALEHQEPWPQGRSNHYNFDLNRDWAWQTQAETVQRLKKYNEWLPQVHVDYHEQGYNAPYYFAPAAEPYHDVITPWQREFQVLIGKSNARYFDKNGWLYFTKEEFDLFYPSYGDTYPIYNGAIGMTFEQGGIGAGLAIQTNDGDTLTLTDRVEHHYTTAMSTVETAAGQAGRLVKEFHAYFLRSAADPQGPFSAYYLCNDSFGDRMIRLKEFLSRNGIRWNMVNDGSFTGMNYETGRQAGFQAVEGDIIVPAGQPKSNLVRVLFERQSRISDSVTYDITAWSIPYVYGLQAYGLSGSYGAGRRMGAAQREVRSAGIQAAATPSDTSRNSLPPYGLAVRWAGMNSARFLSRLLQKGVKVRSAERPFESGKQSFGRGTLLITTTGNAGLGGRLWQVVADAAAETGVKPLPIASGLVDKGADFGSSLVHYIRRPRVGIFTGDNINSLAAGEIWHLFDQELAYPFTRLNAEGLGHVNMGKYDILILPDGDYRALEDKAVNEALRTWVAGGGHLIAMGSVLGQLAKMDWGIREKEEKEDGHPDKKEEEKDVKADDYSALHRYEDRQREEVMNSVPGSIYRVQLDNTHPLGFGYPDHYYTLKQDDAVYGFIKEKGWNVGVIKKDNYISGFAGNKAREKLKDGLIFGVQDMGSGEVIYLADDPLFRSFWENGKLLFCNAVFMVGQ